MNLFWFFDKLSYLRLFFAIFCFPGIPFPLLEMCEAVNTEKGDGAVIFVPVVGVELDADVAVEIPDRAFGMEEKGLRGGSG